MKKPVAIDLFSGVGGLSLGLQKAGFDVRVAVEVSEKASETYLKNHPSTDLILRDIRKVKASEILAKVKEPISLLAGCAPCQGFSSLTRKNKKDDPRNQLLLEMLRLVRGLKPTVVFMENVPGIEQRGKKILKRFTDGLESMGYHVESRVIQMADFGIPQSRRRFVLIGSKGDKIDLPQPTHARIKDKNKKQWRSLKDVIGSMPQPISFSAAVSKGGPRKFNWHVVGDLKEPSLKRLEAAIPGKSWKLVDEALRPKCHQGDYIGFHNAYGRMTWDQISSTITRGFISPCHGRFGHPNKTRTTISVREAALIQTFPINYKFETESMQAVCEMIGNAVPPLFAKKVATKIYDSLV